VSAALYDRMEVIELSGYTKTEKFSIFHDHLLPKVHKKIGLDRFNVKVDFRPEIVDKLINDYAREPGVRNLEKMLLRIYEKIAFDFFKKNHDLVLQAEIEQKPAKEGVPADPTPLPNLAETTYNIDAPMIREYLGPKRFFSQTIFHQKEDLIGFAFGLGYNAFGGSVLSIEVLEVPSLAQGTSPNWDFLSHIENIAITRPRVKEPDTDSSVNEVGVPDNTKQDGSLIATGSLGAVMKESVEIAYSFAKFYLYKANKDPTYLESKNLHIHFPEGASKKDGPSAGITIVTALISAATRIPFNPEFAMTGEISLNGKVLKIGGLKEKVLAAKREGISKIIAPKSNAREVEEMKPDVKEGVEFHFVENYDEVYQLLFESNVPNV
jgi:Lon-like ATP-dependent protease